ncbi:MAG TPA: AAA family ATPase [Candidatus Micrarchaeia archaeon]|nr:AAA family ATPase [Candidatus Micrarchaeia archaeon]
MRILRLNLRGFGGLTGIFEFDQPFTLVAGPNEAGKSTLHQALRVALCGLELPARGRRPRETGEVLRHFRPWKGGPFGLDLDLELGGRPVRIERDLDHADRVRVLDLDRGLEITDQFRRGRGVDVAAALGMGRESFLAVTTVAQSQLLDLDAAVLQEDLQRAAATSGSEMTARAAIDRLQAYRVEEVGGPRTHKRPLDTVREQIDELERELVAARAARAALGDELTEERRLEAQLAEAASRGAQAEAGWHRAELGELDADLRRVSEIDGRLQALPVLELPPDPDAIREAAAGAAELAEQLRTARESVTRLTPADPRLVALAPVTSATELMELATTLERPVPPLPAQRSHHAGLEYVDRREVERVRVVADVLAVAGGVAGLLLFVLALVAPAGHPRVAFFFGGIIVLAVTAVVFLGLQRRLRGLLATGGFSSVAELRRAQGAGDAGATDPEVTLAVEAQRAIVAARSRARERLDALRAPRDPGQVRGLAAALPATQAQLEELTVWTKAAARIEAEALDRARRADLPGRDPSALLSGLVQLGRALEAAEAAAARRRELAGQREERLHGREPEQLAARAEELRRGLRPAEGTGPSEAPIEVSAQQARARFDAVRTEVEEVRRRLLPLTARLRERAAGEQDLAQLEERRADLIAEAGELEAVGASIDLALAELERAEELIHRTLAPKLAATLADWLARVTGARYERAAVDPQTLAIRLAGPAAPTLVALTDLSQGTQEQVYLCLRMALARLLSPKQESLPLVFDDPFVNTDDRRCAALLDAIRELAGATQIVVFSHERRVADWAAAHEVNTVQLTPWLAAPSGEAAPAATVDRGDVPTGSEPPPSPGG